MIFFLQVFKGVFRKKLIPIVFAYRRMLDALLALREKSGFLLLYEKRTKKYSFTKFSSIFVGDVAILLERGL